MFDYFFTTTRISMKKTLLTLVFVAIALSVSAANAPKINYVDATKLTHIGKLSPTTNPYHRVEVEKYPELNTVEANLLKMTSGQMVVFETDAPEIWVDPEYGEVKRTPSSMPMAAAMGFNLYIEKDGELLWAASRVRSKDQNAPLCLIKNMERTMKRCVVYLPLFAELTDLKVGVPRDCTLRKAENPFRHTIAVFGSSFTHGYSASCAGQTWPAFLSRSTGFYLCSYGMSGNSKLQRVMGDILGQTNADAYICDAFSNPSVKIIGERIRPFIEAVRKHNPTAPIIFLRTIHRESRNFDTAVEKKEHDRILYVEKLMCNEILKEYKNVYFVNVADQTGTDHETSADGIHPHSGGYQRWAQAIEKPILKILKKHNIK